MTTTGPSDAVPRAVTDPKVQARPDPQPVDTALETRLRKVRWGVRGALAVGVAASVAANILHANPHPVSQVIAAWPPLALALTVELISRVPVHRRALAVVRLLATAAIAGIAAWVSYFHMAGVVSRYGETGTVPYLLPLSVDGLVIVASISLVELAGRIQDSEKRVGDPLLPTRDSRSVPVPAEPGHSAAAATDGTTPVHVVDLDGQATSPRLNGATPAAASSSHAEQQHDLHDRRLGGAPASVEPFLPGDDTYVEDDTVPGQGLADGAYVSIDGPPAPPAEPRIPGNMTRTAVIHHVDEPPPSRPDVDRWRADEQPPGAHPAHEAVLDDDGDGDGDGDGDRADSTPDDDMPATAAAITAWLRSDPTLQPADIAVKIDRSLRTVRRHWKTAAAQAQAASPTPPTATPEVDPQAASRAGPPGELRR